MAISKKISGWLVDIQPGGRSSKRFRKIFNTLAEAKAFQAWVTTKTTQSPEWAPPPKEKRKLSELIDVWFKHHGSQLRSGSDTQARLFAMAEALGNPSADRFKAEMFADYRAKRLADGISASCLNREHAYLRAVFNELRRLGHWKAENPLSMVRQFKVEERELSFLTLEQIGLLLDVLDHGVYRDAAVIARICLATGSRWSEAENLRGSQVRNSQIHFSKTKSGKNRSVPIAEPLDAQLLGVSAKRGSGRLFQDSYEDFRRAIEVSGLELPRGQLTHVLRHTFASHFMMNGGNILMLQKLLGHSSLTMTMRYAHFAPDHLQEAKTLNPLSQLSRA